MPEPWMFLPSNILKLDKLRQDAESWSSQQLTALADQWAERQGWLTREYLREQENLRPPQQQAGLQQGIQQQAGGLLEQAKPTLAEWAQRAGEGAQKLGEAYEQYVPEPVKAYFGQEQEQARATAEAISRGGERIGAVVRGEDWQQLPSAVGVSTQELSQSLSQRGLPGELAAMAMPVPSAVVGLGEVKAGAKLAGKLAGATAKPMVRALEGGEAGALKLPWNSKKDQLEALSAYELARKNKPVSIASEAVNDLVWTPMGNDSYVTSAGHGVWLSSMKSGKWALMFPGSNKIHYFDSLDKAKNAARGSEVAIKPPNTALQEIWSSGTLTKDEKMAKSEAYIGELETKSSELYDGNVSKYGSFDKWPSDAQSEWLKAQKLASVEGSKLEGFILDAEPPAWLKPEDAELWNKPTVTPKPAGTRSNVDIKDVPSVAPGWYTIPKHTTIDEAKITNEAAKNPKWRAWIADSKVQNIVYHGARGGAQAKKILEGMFGGDIRLGWHFGTLQSARDRLAAHDKEGGPIGLFWLKIKNPIETEDIGSGSVASWANELARQGIIDDTDKFRSLHTLYGSAHPNMDEKEATRNFIREFLESLGFDGHAYKNSIEDPGSISYQVFRPEQIKSIDAKDFIPGDPIYMHTPPAVAGTVGGGTYGYVSSPENSTEEERWNRALNYGALAGAGGLAASVAGRAIQKSIPKLADAIKKKEYSAPSAERSLKSPVFKDRVLTPYDTPEVIVARELLRNVRETHLITSPERQALRSKVFHEFYGTGAPVKNRQAIIILGPPATYKSTMLADPLAKQLGAMVIDGDSVMQRLPEFNEGLGAQVVHREAAALASTLIDKVAEAGDNIVYPMIGTNESVVNSVIERLSAGKFSTQLIYMDAPIEKAAQNAVRRYLNGGRFVDPSYVLKVGERSKSTFNKLKNSGMVAGYAEYRNELKGTIKLVDKYGNVPITESSRPAAGGRVTTLAMNPETVGAAAGAAAAYATTPEGEDPIQRAAKGAFIGAGGVLGARATGFAAPKVASFIGKKIVENDIVWDRSRNIIARMGEPGQQLSNRIVAWRNQAETAAGGWTHRLQTARNLSKQEFDNFVDVAEGKAQPVNGRVQQAAAEWDAVRREVFQEAQTAGMDVNYRDNYFPHRFDPKVIEDIYKSAGDKGYTKWIRQLDNMVQNGVAKNHTEAEAILYQLRDKIRIKKASNLELERVFNLPGYQRDVHAMLSYLSESADAISHAYQFGPKDEIANRLITRAIEQGHDGGKLRAAFGMASGGTQTSNRAVDITRAANVFTKLGLGALTNAAQSINTATVTGGMRTLLNTPRAMFSAEAKEFAIQAGVTLDSTIAKIREGGGVTSKMSAIGAPGFNTVERFNRTLAAVAGRDMARDAARKGNAKVLESLGLDPAAIQARGGKLTVAEEIKAGRNVVERTQFKVDPQDLAPWMSTPIGKLVMQFRTFSYNQTAFMAREIVQPALKGNIKPLARFLIYGAPVGAGLVEVQDFLRQRNPNETLQEQVLRYYQRIGGIGVLGEIMSGLNPPGEDYASGERYAMQATGLALGPTAGTAVQGIAAIPPALGGKPEQLEKFALRQVPVVGPTLANTLVPRQPQGAIPRAGGNRLQYPGTRQGGSLTPTYPGGK